MECPDDLRPLIPPGCWESLTAEDKHAFSELREILKRGRPIKELRTDLLGTELSEITKFIDRSEHNKAERSILVGYASAGSIIYLNTQILRRLVGKCKSSINYYFQQCGYISVKMKTKNIDKLTDLLPPLLRSQPLIKQWSSRIKQNDRLQSIQEVKTRVAVKAQKRMNFDTEVDWTPAITDQWTFGQIW